MQKTTICMDAVPNGSMSNTMSCLVLGVVVIKIHGFGKGSSRHQSMLKEILINKQGLFM